MEKYHIRNDNWCLIDYLNQRITWSFDPLSLVIMIFKPCLLSGPSHNPHRSDLSIDSCNVLFGDVGRGFPLNNFFDLWLSVEILNWYLLVEV